MIGQFPRRLLKLARVVTHIVLAVARVFVQFPLLGQSEKRRHVQYWSTAALAIFNIRPIFYTHPQSFAQQSYLYVANHMSWLDIFVIWTTADVRFVAKSDLERWPLFGKLAKHLGVIFIDRTRRSGAHKAVQDVAAVLESGQSVCIFPEGTTTTGSNILPFHPALFQAAIETRAPIQPLALRYLTSTGRRAEEPAFTGNETLVYSLWRLSAVSNLTAEIFRLDRLESDQSNRRDLAEKCRRMIELQLGEAINSPPDDSRADQPNPLALSPISA